jgi:hypothetical protein
MPRMTAGVVAVHERRDDSCAGQTDRVRRAETERRSVGPPACVRTVRLRI